MKSFLPHVAALAVLFGGFQGYKFATAPTPPPEMPQDPSPTAQKIIDSMKIGNGWRFGKTEESIVHEKADLTIKPGRTTATVTTWDHPRNINTLDKNDLANINYYYKEAKEAILNNQLQKLE